MSETGSLELICGCMFSGKTTALIRRFEEIGRGKNVLSVKPAIDHRYSPTDIVSHDGRRLEARAVHSPIEIVSLSAGAEVIFIDEVHFFDETVVNVCRDLVGQGRAMVCAGLDRDMWGDVFLHMEQLGRLGRKTVLLGRCAVCGQPANRTQRTAPFVDGNLVGGPEAFEARCERCFTPLRTPKPKTATSGLAMPCSVKSPR